MDLRLVWTPDGADLVLENGDLALDPTALPASLVSLFSDARAPAADDKPVLEQDLRGWWAGPIGSLLWTLRRAKLLPETAAIAKEYCEASLAWMIAEGIAAAVEVETSAADGVLRISVKITRGTARRWSHLWKERPYLVVQWPPESLNTSVGLSTLVA